MACVPEPVDILRCGPAEWSEILRRGARAWNAWRDDYPWIIPDLTGIAPSVIECQLGPLTGGPINLANARLRGALLGRATLPATIDMGRLGGRMRARWFDPASGRYQDVPDSPFPGAGVRTLTPPGSNADGDPDWVLILEAVNRSPESAARRLLERRGG